MANSSRRLVLSLFPGIGLLDRAFEDVGFCVVRGPDLLWGGDVLAFHPPRGIWDGVIGGPPCQDFSAARRADDPPTGNGVAMLMQFARCVTEAQPDWFILENVVGVPDIGDQVPDYEVQRLNVEQAWFVPIRRLRCFQFGRHNHIKERTTPLDIPRRDVITPNESTALACDRRPFDVLKRLQGLPADFDLPGFSDEGRRRAVGNGVGLVLGRVVAAAVCQALGFETQSKVGPATVAALPRCETCGVIVTGKAKTCSTACRSAKSRGRRGLSKRRVDA